MNDFDAKLGEVFDGLAGWWTVKNVDSVFTYMNRGLADAVGFRHPQDCLGLTDADLPSRVCEFAETFQLQDQEVIATQKHMRTLEVHPLAGNRWRAYIVNKSFHLDPLSGGKQVICHAFELSTAGMVELGAALNRSHIGGKEAEPTTAGSYRVGRCEEADLTRREAEVLFFVLRGRNAKAIARVLGLSPRTVEQYIDVLKQKFAAHSRTELVDAALAADCFNFIPESLFNQHLSLVLREK
ncbi:MAG: LuxR C-terminal-related transcriptional regulator [Janthinobacterium lividum]